MNRWQLGHRPGLDGLRGLAILFVLLAHFDNHFGNPLSGAGGVGVLMFFTLSGFLITSLLVGESSKTGRVSLGGFYQRRAFRLLPALVVMLAAVAAIQAAGRSLRVPGSELLATLFYVGNWWQISNPGIDALSHTWSLAIEEQFYLIWPVVFILAARRGSRAVSVAAAVGVGVSAVAMFLPTAHVERGTLEYAAALLAGCLLALYMAGRGEGRSRPWLAAAALVALLPLAFLRDTLPFQVYLLGVPAAMVVMLWSSAQGTGVRWLSGPALGWFGRRSYGIYLWHYPIIVALPVRDSMPPWVMPVLLVPLCLLVAELSWRLIEAPALRLRRRSGDARYAAQELVGHYANGRGTPRAG